MVFCVGGESNSDTAVRTKRGENKIFLFSSVEKVSSGTNTGHNISFSCNACWSSKCGEDEFLLGDFWICTVQEVNIS